MGDGEGPPREPISRLTEPLVRFMHVESASGVVLLGATITALILANSGFSDGYLAFWKTPVGFEFGSITLRHSLVHWINDGLMALFFFVIGLEVKREIVHGELGDIRQAALPIAAAIGGMVVPAGIYLALQAGEPAQSGWGIPMATDIAFVVGCLALLGPRVPRSFRVLLLSLAIADDIGAILVIAIGYTDSIGWIALGIGFAGIGVIELLSRLGVRSFGLYVLLGVVVWEAFHESGVHATVAGVILGLMTPARAYLSTSVFARTLQDVSDRMHGDWEAEGHRTEHVRSARWAARETISPLEYLENTLHPWVGFAIMPIFALANAGVVFEASDLVDPVAVAIAAGLLIGKPLGIVGVSWLAVRAGLAHLPVGVSWATLTAGGMLAAIGFTMALFIAGLALEGETLDAAKVGILCASAVAAVVGMAALVTLLPPAPKPEPGAAD
jgi:NhaA family Na+:H+ antiporter